MGNCITTRERITRNDHDNKRDDQFPTTTRAEHQHASERKHYDASPNVTNASTSSRPKRKKTVSFRLSEEEGGGRGAAAGAGLGPGMPVRIRVLVTQEELKEILNYKSNMNSSSSSCSKYSSVEQLLSSLRLISASRRISGVRDASADQLPAGCNGGWIPGLDSIPE
ncbi:hypothetical protein Ancab_008042 [Ancistrocladus abbreviatus]